MPLHCHNITSVSCYLRVTIPHQCHNVTSVSCHFRVTTPLQCHNVTSVKCYFRVTIPLQFHNVTSLPCYFRVTVPLQCHNVTILSAFAPLLFTLYQAMIARRERRGYSFILSLTSALQKDGWSTPRLGRSFRIVAKNTCYFLHALPTVFPRVSERLPADALREI